jgi:hypothetical protein
MPGKPKLHQILAVESDIRNQTQKDLSAAHHGLQKVEMLKGQARTYQPVSETGDKLPPEGNLLQVRVPDVIRKTQDILVKMFDVVATRDFGNLHATADLEVDGKLLLEKAPATFLLWLEKKLIDIHTFVCKLPTLPADTAWTWDANQMCWRSAEVKTHRTKKVEDFKVIVPATPQHPAQVGKFTNDLIEGWWTTINYSGAMPADVIAHMKERVETLMKATKFAREKANQVEVDQKEVGRGIMKFIFGE